MSGPPLSVVIPTLGRSPLLRACVSSVLDCRESAEEVLVVDQSGSGAATEVLAGLGSEGVVRVVRDDRRGVGNATNLGLARARTASVLVTHDDCTVEKDWIGQARKLISRDAETLWTGRVLPAGDPRAIPSTIDDPEPRDYTGQLSVGALYPNNMVLPREAALALGGFDDRVLRAEDNDFCYRWLASGLSLRYDPCLVVSHHEWRNVQQLSQLHLGYWRGQGLLYAKHLRRRDRAMLRFLLRDLESAARSAASALLFRRPRWTDPRQGLLPGLVGGLWQGWALFSDEPAAATSWHARTR